MDLDQLQELAVAMQALKAYKAQGDIKTKASTVANYNTAQLIYQPQGLFDVTGIRRDVISTHIQPMGLGDYIPAIPSTEDDPRYGFVLGWSADIGDEAEFPCDDAPTNYMKGGTLTARFGRVMRDTDTIEIDRLLHTKRGVNTDLRLINNMFNGGGPMSSNLSQDQILSLVVKNQMVGAGVSMGRKLNRMFWAGAIGNDTAGGGYKEFPGLDSQIATGQIDAETGTAMPSADSDIKDFGYDDVAGDGRSIVEYLSMLEYYLRYKATRQNMMPVTWALVMRPELWFELTAVWPCLYLTHRCRNDGGDNAVVINDRLNVEMRDQMRSQMTLPINGRNYQVILDDGIHEHTNVNNENLAAGNFASSIYFVPLRVRGNFPVLYWEHIDYTDVSRQISPMGMGASKINFWTDSGRFLWAVVNENYCFKMKVKVEPRVVLRTPHLAGKLQNVSYSPLQHLVGSHPDDPYWQNGGVSVRGTSENFAVWGNFAV